MSVEAIHSAPGPHDPETQRLIEEGRVALERDQVELVKKYAGKAVVYKGNERLLIAANPQIALGLCREAGHRLDQLTVASIEVRAM